MNLKPFNLEKALMGDPVVTRDGKPVSEIVRLKTVPTSRSVICVVDGRAYATSETGKCYTYNTESANDLFMAPKIITKGVWLNIYPDTKIGNDIHPSKQIADHMAESDRVACVYVTWQEQE